MTIYLLPGVCGLLLGILLHWTGLTHPAGVRCALGLQRSHAARSAWYAVGCAMLLTALLCWLAVIDVDTIAVYPLHGGVLLGGAVFGVAAGLCGFTPMTAFAGVGASRPVEALCALAGCFLAAMLPLPEGLLASLPPHSDATLFRVTLDEPFLLGGGFLAQGCTGLLLMVIGACIPSPRRPAAPAEEPPMLLLPAPAPEDAPEDAFVALLPGEEALVVDTELDAAEPASPEEPTSPEEPASPDEPASPEETAPEDASSDEDAPADEDIPEDEPSSPDEAADDESPEDIDP